MTSHVWKKQSKREVDLQQREQARRHRTSSEAKKVVRKSKEVNVKEGRDGRWEDGQIPWSVEWRGKMENGKGCGQTYSSASSATDRLLLAAALSGLLGASATRHLETNKKKKRGRGCGGEVGCEEEEEDARRRSGGNAACWCGVVRRGLLAHLIQSWKKRRRLEESKAGLEFK